MQYQYQVTGVDAKSGKERQVKLAAVTQQEALAAAKAEGIMATSVIALCPAGGIARNSARFIPPADASFANVFNRYVGRVIGINFRDAEKYESAILVTVTDDHFAVHDPNEGLIYHFPLRMVLGVVEPQEGGAVSSGVFSKHALLVQVFHMIIYKGAVGVSMSF